MTPGDVARWAAEAVADLPALCTVEEAIRVLRLSRRHFYRLTAAGKISALQQAEGGRLLVPRAEISRYLEGLA